MKTPLALIFSSAGLLLILQIVFHYRAHLPDPELIAELFPEVRLLAYVAFAAGAVGLLLNHNVERFEPLVENAFAKISQDLRDGIEASLRVMNSTMQDGFNVMAVAFAKEVRGASQAIWQGFSDVRVEEHLIANIQSPKLKTLVKEHRIQEAIAELDDFYAKNVAERQQQLSLLLLSNDEKDWTTALSILDQDESLQKPDHFLTLAFRYWSVKKIEVSIGLAERGLKLVKDAKLLARFQNSLAYYYADADIPTKQSLAFEYAEAAAKARPNESGPLDTLGYVKISYGKTKEEILDGVALCTKALQLGSRFELYAKSIGKADLQLKKLPKE